MTTDQIKYPYLPEGRAISYVPENDKFMLEAKRVRNEESTDGSWPTGAIVVKDGKIIGSAANQAALQNKKLYELHKKGWCVRRMLKIKSGEKYWLCPGCAKNKDHAEAGAVRDALKKNKNIEGADLYLYGHWWACQSCWDSMVAAGIKNVYLSEDSAKMFKR